MGKGDVFENNYIYAPEMTVAVKEEKSADNKYSGNKFVGSLQIPAAGFEKQKEFSINHFGIMRKIRTGIFFLIF